MTDPANVPPSAAASSADTEKDALRTDRGADEHPGTFERFPPSNRDADRNPEQFSEFDDGFGASMQPASDEGQPPFDPDGGLRQRPTGNSAAMILIAVAAALAVGLVWRRRERPSRGRRLTPLTR